MAIVNPNHMGMPGLHKTCKDKLIEVSTEAPRGDVMIEAAWNEYVRNNPDEVTLVFSNVPVKTNYKVRHFQASCMHGPEQIFMKLHDVVMYNKNLDKKFGSMYVAWTTDWF